MAALTVREAKRDDCRELLRMIKELAVFEKYTPNGPIINEKDLERDAFDLEHPFFFCYVIEDPSDALKLIAYAMYYFTYGTWSGRRLYLREFYVADAYRGKGVGNLLFKKVVQKAEETNCTDMAWAALNWNPATYFYKARGARDVTVAEGWHIFNLGPEGMKAVAGNA